MPSAKEQIWLAEYLKTFNATEAARRANYAHPNVQGAQKKKKFAEEIDAAIQENIMSADEALSMLSDIANFDPSPYVRQEGRAMWLDVKKMKEDGYGHLVREVYTTKDGPRVKTADPDWAKEIVLKHQTGVSGSKDDPHHLVIKHVNDWRKQDAEDD